ncbi:MAG TPA: hypothetical protein VFT74_11960 [Isosphaeraceae bacterium]|nr:hypothetical protein [Isosphaeraceae bacterium]
MDPQTVGWIGGLGGAVIGVLGGVLGSIVVIRNASGPRERTFVIQASLVSWVAVSMFLLGLWLIPSPFRLLLWPPYLILLPLGIRYWNRRQAQIRHDETTLA